MSRVVDFQTIFLGIEVNLVLAILDGVDVILNIIKAVFEESAEEAGSLGLCHGRVLLRRGDQWWPSNIYFCLFWKCFVSSSTCYQGEISECWRHFQSCEVFGPGRLSRCPRCPRVEEQPPGPGAGTLRNLLGWNQFRSRCLFSRGLRTLRRHHWGPNLNISSRNYPQWGAGEGKPSGRGGRGDEATWEMKMREIRKILISVLSQWVAASQRSCQLPTAGWTGPVAATYSWIAGSVVAVLSD